MDISGYSFRGSAIPHGDGIHYMVVNKLIRAAIGVAQEISFKSF